MDYVKAKDLINSGGKVKRKSWGEGSFIYLVNPSIIEYSNLRNEAATHLDSDRVENKDKKVLISSHIDMYNGHGAIVVGWKPTSDDILSDDWEEI